MLWFLKINTSKKAHFFLFWISLRFQHLGPTSLSSSWPKGQRVGRPSQGIGLLRNPSSCLEPCQDDADHCGPPGGGGESVMVPEDYATWGRMICIEPTDAACPVMGCSAGDAEHMNTKQGHRHVGVKSEATSHDLGQPPSLQTLMSPLFHSCS